MIAASTKIAAPKPISVTLTWSVADTPDTMRTIGEHVSNTAAITPFATGMYTKIQSQKPQLLSAFQTSQPFPARMIPAVTAAVAKSVLYHGSAGASRVGP